MRVKLLFKLIYYTGLPILFRIIHQRKNVTAFLFHRPTSQDFNKSILILRKHYNLISLERFLEAVKQKKNMDLPSYSVIITFDDGHLGNFDLLPDIIREEIPATVFLCSGIVNSIRGYWFHHVPDDIDREELKKLTNQKRLDLLYKSGFLEEKDQANREALSLEEIKAMKPHVSFQSHTVFHPILPQCQDEEAWKEISESKIQLEKLLKSRINAFAYPNGEYNARDVEMLKKAGYECAFTVDPGYITASSDLYKLKRISLNDSSDKYELIVKASGLWALLKKWAPKL